ncbi:hypothetical protein MTO96_011882 [Rhipicephalus appendiculatus]
MERGLGKALAIVRMSPRSRKSRYVRHVGSSGRTSPLTTTPLLQLSSREGLGTAPIRFQGRDRQDNAVPSAAIVTGRPPSSSPGFECRLGGAAAAAFP